MFVSFIVIIISLYRHYFTKSFLSDSDSHKKTRPKSYNADPKLKTCCYDVTIKSLTSSHSLFAFSRHYKDIPL